MPALAANSAIPAGIRRKQAFDSTEPRSLYVHRPLKNAEAIREWAKAQGFKTTLPASDMHATIAFSKEPVDWNGVPDGFDSEIVPASTDQKNGARSVETLGDKGAVVLRFESTDLASRWRQFRRIGASWDHESYQPHVTITYDAGDIDLSKVVPYDGPLEFGEEVFAEVDSDWADKVKKNLQATDIAMAMDRSFSPTADSRFEIAMDRDSVREKTKDGRLIVKRTHVTKANVCPYRGKEIPGWEALGLEPDRIYNLLRDPEELAKAAPTLNGVQLLIKHIPVNAGDHRPNETVGSLGSDAEFDGEYLDNSLYVNAQHAIDAIETGNQKELSAGYHYKPDMTPGNFRGTAFDGVMRDIVFNHVALVEDGRAGPDVVVGDEALKENDMKVTRLGARALHMTAAAFAPLMAMDSKVTLPSTLFRDLTTKNFKDNRTKVLAGVRLALDGKLAKGIALDGSIEKFGKALDAFIDDVNSGMDEPAPEAAAPEIEKTAEVEGPKAIAAPGTYDAEPLKGFMRDCGMDDAQIAKCMDMMPKNGLAGDAEESEEDKKKREKEEADKAAAKDAEMKDMVSKPAMDAALAAQSADFDKRVKAVRDNERAIRMALDSVRPWVGEIPPSMAFDSAADVVRQALNMKQHPDFKTLHADALMPILKTYPKIGARPANDGGLSEPIIAMDAVNKAVKIAPGLEHISNQL